LFLALALIVASVLIFRTKKQDQQIAKYPDPRSNPKSFVNTVGIRMNLIPAGEFMMGSDDYLFPDERPQHRVRISKPFYLGIHEVTRGQFRRFVKATGYRTEAEKDPKGGLGWNGINILNFVHDPKYSWLNPGFEQSDDHPVVIVTWNDAVAFCDWLGKEEARPYRLPTEAEWEYSCRAGTSTGYFSGDEPETLANFANTADASFREACRYVNFAIEARDGFVYTAPVGRFQPNAFGLYDMHGNVWELCRDGYDDRYYRRSPAVDPRGPSQAAARVMRGGGWVDRPLNLRSAEREGHAPTDQASHLGFRVALEQSPATPDRPLP
jgi:formylglycine-generating enzyme required for sulfatase activity